MAENGAIKEEEHLGNAGEEGNNDEVRRAVDAAGLGQPQRARKTISAATKEQELIRSNRRRSRR